MGLPVGIPAPDPDGNDKKWCFSTCYGIMDNDSGIALKTNRESPLFLGKRVMVRGI